jgi:hypothetical protein
MGAKVSRNCRLSNPDGVGIFVGLVDVDALEGLPNSGPRRRLGEDQTTTIDSPLVNC